MQSHSVGCEFSPTYLSTNLLSPLRSPYRETVPKTNIISGGTYSNRAREDWGAFASDYGGIGNNRIGCDLPAPSKTLDFPRSHRHFISGLSKVIHNKVHPHAITSLLRSNCHQHDQFIEEPCSIKNFGKMREENKFVQEPTYSSHICRTAMFPLSTLEEYEVFQLQQPNLVPRPPLCEKTTREVSGVIRRRYKSTSYERDYESPHNAGSNHDTPEIETNRKREKKLKPSFTQPCRIPKKLRDLAKKALGFESWPCWPAGNRYIISTVTGQIVEKRDILSLDDLRDFRFLRRKSIEVEAENDKESKEKKETEADEKQNKMGTKKCIGCNTENEGAGHEEIVKKNLVESKRKELNTRNLRTARKWRREYELSPAQEHILPQLPAYTLTKESSNRGMTAAMLEANRAEETLYLLLKSLTNGPEKDRASLVAPPGIYDTLYEMERREHPVLLPPDPMYRTLSYSGDRIADRLGVRYKTVAMKRYHGIHPETVPDLRDFRPPVRKCKWLGYHTSMFR